MNHITHGTVTGLSRCVHRITAPNPGVMTGPGTNSYLIGKNELVLIDPGPDIDAHVDALLAGIEQINGKLKWILCTHTHLDHSPAAAPLQAATGATVIGMPAPSNSGQDSKFQPDLVWQDGDRLQADGFSLRAVHTPGHASNHLCFYLEQENWLFTGDHIMEGSTVVIVPPDGDMKAYLESLEALKLLHLTCLAPAHGHIITNPMETIEGLIRHRLGREDKVVRTMATMAAATVEQLTEKVYDDVPAALHGIAKYSLLAHLEKLEKENRASRQDALWALEQGH